MAINNISTTVRDAMCDAFVDAIDTGGAGSLDGYTTAFGTLLFQCAFSATAFGASSGGTATANAISDDATPAANGTAAVLRIINGAAATVAEGTITATGGGGDLELSSTTISTTIPVSITSATITQPAS